MTPDVLLPAWAQVTIAVLLVAGGLLALVGTLGLWRFDSFYQRMHGPALVNTGATACVMLASALAFTLTTGELRPHELLVIVFVVITVPVTVMVLSRAALYRHRRIGKTAVPEPHDPARRAALERMRAARRATPPDVPGEPGEPR